MAAGMVALLVLAMWGVANVDEEGDIPSDSETAESAEPSGPASPSPDKGKKKTGLIAGLIVAGVVVLAVVVIAGVWWGKKRGDGPSEAHLLGAAPQVAMT